MNKTIVTVITMGCLATAGCSDSSDSDGTGGAGGAGAMGQALEVVGTYEDNFDTVHRVSAATWIIGASSTASTFRITQHDNAAGFLVAENDAGNEFNPGLWSRFEWTRFQGDLYFCQIAFDAADESAAAAAGPADAADPASAGCGGFSWSMLQDTPELHAVWDDDFGTTHTVDRTSWTQESEFGTSVFRTTQFDNDDDFLIAQNDSANEFNPDLFSRFEWVESGGETFFCQVSFDSATEADALAAGPADASDPATAGCGDFAWSRIARK